jgi:dihydroxyacetone kinase-like predicted kinase
VVNGETAAADRPPLDFHTVAVATNMESDYPPPKGLEQLLAVTRVVTQISEDQSIAVIAGVNLGQGTGARTAPHPVNSKHELKERIMAAIKDVNRHPVIHT